MSDRRALGAWAVILLGGLLGVLTTAYASEPGTKPTTITAR